MTKTILSTVACVCTLLALPLQAKTALIDFGNASGLVTSSGGLTYNSPNFNGTTDTTGVVGLNDTIGASTGWSINVNRTSAATSDAGFSGGGATYGGTKPAAISAYDTNATSDNIFFNEGDQLVGQLTVTLTGLDNSKTYRLLFYGSRASSTGTQTWHLTTGNGTEDDDVSHAPGANSSTVVEWKGIAPVGGVIEFTISVDGGVGALNFGEVVEVEPATALLDFNPTSGSPVSSAYNVLSLNASDTTGIVGLNDMNRTATGWSIDVSRTSALTSDAGNAGGGATYSGTKPAALAGFEPNALNDNFYFNEGDQAVGQLTVTLSGLDNTKTYDLLFYGSRAAATGIQTWNLITGAGTAPEVSHAPGANAMTVVDWNGIAPVGGVIAFTVTVDGGIGALNFGQVVQVDTTPSSPYADWATGDEVFTDDANGDGVKNGLAWILGADDPTVSALNKLPVVTTPTGFLQLEFTRENPYAPAKLYVEFGNDLTGWTKLLIRDDTGTISGSDVEVVVISPGSPTPDTVQVKIPTTHASGSGKLFARLGATEN